MTMNRNIFVILILAVFFVSCNDLLDPTVENFRNKTSIYTEPNFGLNLLTNAYAKIPTNNWSFNDVATDDAVSNDPANGYRKMATGYWAASNNPVDQWNQCNTGIQYANILLGEVMKIRFADDEQINTLFKDRLRGEAYGLRALLMFNILQAHAGWNNGKLLGFPIFLTELTSTSNFNIARADFNTCVAQIYQDVDSAKALLPVDYVDIANAASLTATFPKYAGIATTDYTKFNRVMGVKFLGLMSGKIAKAIKAQTALLAASPAFATGAANASTGKWEDAATVAADLITAKGGINGLPYYTTAWSATQTTWYDNSTEIAALTNGATGTESLWRAGTNNYNAMEGDNFPPTLYGNGRINPTQNLVDAFPDKNGYPITNPATVYVSTAPYTNRDPRLNNFIVVHGSKFGTANTTVMDFATGDNAVNAKPASTRTGYYMRKLLRHDVNYNPTGRNNQMHVKPRIRWTEIYLIYAEAANEAWGPLADPKANGYTAYDVIKAIRKRAMNLTTDPYLESIKNDQGLMRQLIRNERRLELCFEGFRFWDLRRWKVSLSDLSAPALGVTITGTPTAFTLSAPTTIEPRQYNDAKYYYGPIPYGEKLKWSNLLQNDGW